mgnify:CR=1 FL=1
MKGEAPAEGRKPRSRVIHLTSRQTLLPVVITTVAGAFLLGLIGLSAELNLLPLPRLEPLFASPAGGVTVLFVVIGGSVGGLIGSLWANRSYMRVHRRLKGSQWLSWALTVVIAALIITSVAYIWLLSAAYGPGSDQSTRIGYTLKNVQRIPGDTPEEASDYITSILLGNSTDVPADPLVASIMAPVAASRNETIRYGVEGSMSLEEAVASSVERFGNISFAVAVPATDPAYALPAAYMAAHFLLPVIPVSDDGTVIGADLSFLEGKEVMVAAPPRLIPENFMDSLTNAVRVADDDVYEHALLWAQYRNGPVGWGAEDLYHNDAYYNFAITNPEDPGFAAAGLPTAYKGNYGPLLYTQYADLHDLVDMYFWRISPDFYASPADGPFMNARVIGGPDSVSYNTQARADLALETHPYKDQTTGASALALVGMAWVFMGMIGAAWVLFILPRAIPELGIYPNLYWPLALLGLGPLGMAALFAAYHKRTIWLEEDGSYRVERPPWSQGVSATIMGVSVGIPLMIASMYVVQLNGLPRIDEIFWIGSPMDGVMWFIMVIPAIIISILLYMGPMMASKGGRPYLKGVRRATPLVVISMVSASAGMFSFTWYLMNFYNLMSSEELWLWVTPLWAGAIIGYFTAFIPNYVLARVGWKPGGT